MALLSALAFILSGCIIIPVQGQSPVFQQIWADEFSGCKGPKCTNGLNTSVWSFELGDGTKYGPYTVGWGNAEVECYTNRSQNARVLSSAEGASGVLAIEAQFERDTYSCINPGAASSTRWWTSARLITRNKVAFSPEPTKAIKIEARVKIPTEWGSWPAFWLLPDTPKENCLACGKYGNGWCTSGEIDILEARNRDGLITQNAFFGGIPERDWEGCIQKPNAHNLTATVASSYWNRFSVVWSYSGLDFYINNTLTHSISQAEWYTGAVSKAENPQAPFDQPFFIVLNVAVGGNFVTAQTGAVLVTDTKRAPYRFLVDWVKVYKEL